MVKKQVFEMLSGVCLYSDRGYQLALSALENFKVSLLLYILFGIIACNFVSKKKIAYIILKKVV